MKYEMHITTSSWCLDVQMVQLQAHTLRSLSQSQPEALVAGTVSETLSPYEEGEEEQLYFIIFPRM